MKKDRLLNPQIVAQIAALGHTEYLCIADCGLPIPAGIPVVDVSVTAGIPGFKDVFDAVMSELVVESAIVASEIDDANPSTMEHIAAGLSGTQITRVPHTELKAMLKSAKCVIRTGETSSYANVILVGGVNF